MLPTPRLLVLLLLPALLLAAASAVPALLVPAVLTWLVVLGLVGAEWRLLASERGLAVQRRHEPRLSLGADNPIWLDLENRGGRALAVTLRDETPPTCVAE